MRRRTVVVGLVAAALLGGCAGDGGNPGPTAAPEDHVETPTDDERAEVAFVGFDERPVTLADYRGRPLVVNLFASWCAPCVTEMPAIERVKQAVGDDVAFLGIAVNDRVEDATALVERTGITWDLARDPLGEGTAALGAVGMPTTFLVDGDGTVVEQVTGEITEDELRDLLDRHFGVPG